MKVFKNELIVHRNETFSISKIIQNRDGSPYIISSELTNPYWLITVANSLYEQDGRYIYNKWLNLKNFLRFYYTKPVDLNSLGYDDWNAVLPAGYEGDETSGYANIAVFYLSDNDIRNYRYWVYDNTESGDYAGHWEDYDCKLLTTFTSDITSQWSEQTYYYGILLVSGESVKEYLVETCIKLNLSVEDNIYNMYDSIKNIDSSLLEKVDLNKPITNYDVVYPILEPTKILVQSNLKGGM